MPDWKQIRIDFETGTGGNTPQEIAQKHGVTYGNLRVRKGREKWGDFGKGLKSETVKVTNKTVTKKTKKENIVTVALTDNLGKKTDKRNGKRESKPDLKPLVTNSTKQLRATSKKVKSQEPDCDLEFVLSDMSNELTEREKIFCMQYIRHYNATLAAIQAGYSRVSAHVIGHRLLTKAKIRQEVDRLKGEVKRELMFDAMAVMEIYLKIATTDVNDYVKFGTRKVPLLDDLGKPVVINGKKVMTTESYVTPEEFAKVDGTLISEISQGRDGIKIKFHDKMKALEKLEKYFDLLPDLWQRKIEAEKLKLEQDRLSLEKQKASGGEGPGGETPDDGFIEALNAQAGDVWKDEVKETNEESNV